RSTFQSSYYIQVQRLAKSARLFCSVQYGNLFYGLRNRVDQCLCAERSVETNLYHADFSSCCQQIIDGLLDGITYGTHSDDYVLCICCSVVIEQFIIRTDLFIYLIHVALYDGRKGIVIRITCFSCLEEDIRVLCGTSLTGMIGIQCVSAEFINRIHINQVFQILVIPGFDFLDLMGGTESVKEID